jgi:hypothetical protein
VARKARGAEHGAIGAAGGFDADLGRIEAMLQEALAVSPLPAEAPNADELNEFPVRMRRGERAAARGETQLGRRRPFRLFLARASPPRPTA